MDKKTIMNVVDEALKLSLEVETLDEKLNDIDRKKSVKHILFLSFMIFLGTLMTAVAILFIHVFSQLEIALAIYNFYNDFLIFYLSFFVPLGFLIYRAKKLKVKRVNVYEVYSEKYDELESIELIPRDFQSSYYLSIIKTYFQQGRVDTMKESINLLIKEQNDERRHNEKIKKMDDMAHDANANAAYLSSQIDHIENKVRNLD